jgi:hypothetical protein
MCKSSKSLTHLLSTILIPPLPPCFRGGAKKGTDAKYFSDRTVRKGENLELREELRNPKLEKKRDAVKKVGPFVFDHAL